MTLAIRWTIPLLLVPGVLAAAEPARVDAFGDPLPPGVVMRLGTTRWRPGGRVKFMAFSADGRQLTTVHVKRLSDTELVVWEVSSGRELHRVKVEDSSFDHWVRLASGRSVSVTCDPRGERVQVLEYMNPGQ